MSWETVPVLIRNGRQGESIPVWVGRDRHTVTVTLASVQLCSLALPERRGRLCDKASRQCSTDRQQWLMPQREPYHQPGSLP